MKRGIGIIAALTALLAALALLAVTQEEPAEQMQEESTLEFLVEAGGHTERLQCWKSPEGEYVVFLPGYANLKNIEICPPKGDICTYIDGVQITSLNSLDHFELNTSYPLEWITGGTAVHSTISFVQSGNLPTLYIDVASGSMEYLHLNKNNKESGQLRLYGKEGELLCSEFVLTIKGRGNTSWFADIKPYNITLSQPRNLLDMGAAENWVLLAEEYNDLNLRNKIVYDFAAAAGLACTPDCQWVDLYLNGSYTGLYLLSERNEIHPQRIDIAQEGSFLVSQEYESRLQAQKYPYVRTESGQALRVRYGPADTAALQRQWQSVENAILAENGIDPLTGRHWRELIDLDSWVRKYLIEEVFGNLDAGSLSQYFYYDGGDPQGKIYAGPVWDYDFAMDDESVWLKGYTDYFVMDRDYVNREVYTPWFAALCRQEEFYSRVRELYASDFLPLLEELTDTGISAYMEEIGPSAVMDRIRWGEDVEQIPQKAEHIQTFLRERMDFLTDLWIRETVYHTVRLDPGWDNLYGYFAVRDGQSLPVLPDDDGLGWYNADTGDPFDITQPIYEDVRIVQKKPESALPVIHYLPGLALVLALPGLYLLDRVRTKKNGRRRRDAAKASEISP